MDSHEWWRVVGEQQQAEIENVRELFHQHHYGRIAEEASAELDRIIAHWFSYGRFTDEVMTRLVRSIAPLMPRMPDGAEITEWTEDLDAPTGLTLAEAEERFRQNMTEFELNLARAPQAPTVVWDAVSAFQQEFKKFIAEEFRGNTQRDFFMQVIEEFEAEHPMAFVLGDPSSMAEIREKARETNPN